MPRPYDPGGPCPKCLYVLGKDLPGQCPECGTHVGPRSRARLVNRHITRAMVWVIALSSLFSVGIVALFGLAMLLSAGADAGAWRDAVVMLSVIWVFALGVCACLVVLRVRTLGRARRDVRFVQRGLGRYHRIAAAVVWVCVWVLGFVLLVAVSLAVL